MKYSTIRRHVTAKPYIVYLLSLKILFCVCLAHAGQQEQPYRLRGTVSSAATGVALEGATVKIKGSRREVSTNSDGAFILITRDIAGVLLVSYLGYQTAEIDFHEKDERFFTVQLQPDDNTLDEAVVIGYGTITRRLNTGSVSRVTAEDIARQPVSNPLAALQGRVPGMVVTQTSGVPGSAFNVQIRGQNSILQGSEPFFIIDGVPLVNGNESMSGLTNAAGPNGISSLNALNPNDIESIEVLKDADATAIYGSRGANGVILITTKRNKTGKLEYNVNTYSGINRATRTMDMLNTQGYVTMREEAFSNDNTEPTAANAPDLLLWDTTRYTDMKKLLIGGTAYMHDARLGISGGDAYNQFIIGGGVHRETTVFPGNIGDLKGTFNVNLNHRSPNDKFTINLSANYGHNSSNLTTRDLTTHIILPPHLQLYDDLGNLNWQEGGMSFQSMGVTNPLAQLNTVYKGSFKNLSSNLLASYRFSKAIELKTSFGYNSLNSNERSANPSTSLDPAGNTLPYAFFNTVDRKSWIIEPQLTYTKRFLNTDVQLLLGATLQENVGNSLYASGQNYTSDALLGAISAAGSIITTNGYDQYRYAALFSRLNVNHKDKYILNFTGRRDGSSRFGPGKQFANFGALGAAWIFSEEGFMKTAEILSFGKFRGSYGITGNDQIGNYQYLDSWTSVNTTYQGISPLQPSRLYNPDYSWEVNKKLEAGIELGFFEDKLMLSSVWFRNRSRNQLISYPLPIQTGFNSIIRNFDALVQNTGWEFTVSSQHTIGIVKWQGSFNLTVPENKLLDFPGLENSSYANRYVIGEPLDIKRSYRYLGVDPVSGIYSFDDVNGDGILDIDDRIIYNTTNPSFYGGFSNSFTWKSFRLDIFLEYRKQQGLNYRGSISTPPGYRLINHPHVVLNRWQNAGDITDIQRFVGVATSDAYRPGYMYIADSDASFSDASFLRLKNVSVAYNVPISNNGSLKDLQITCQAQNLFTLTNYVGSDPEIQSLYALPPMRTIVLGINARF